MAYRTIDVETYLIQPGLALPPLVCVGADDGILLAREGIEQVYAWLKERDSLVGHNIAFDLAVIVQSSPSNLQRGLFDEILLALDDGRVHDTLLRDKLELLRKGKMFGKRFSLAACVKRRFGHDMGGKKGDDVWRLRYHELDGVPVELWPTAAREYVEADVAWTRKLFDAQSASPDEAAQVRASWAFQLMSARGIRTDPDRVAEVRARESEAFRRTRAAARQAGLIRSNGTKDLQAIRNRVVDAFEKLGENAPLTDKGSISTSRATLNKSEDEVLIQLGESSLHEKRLKTFVPVLEQGTKVPINAYFNTLVESGRSSCARPNLQNLPRGGGIRECFTARPGYVFVAADYDTLELRTLAQVCLWLFGESEMAKAFRDGLDPHLAFGAELMGITYEEASKRLRAKDPEVKAFRQRAKAANFGYPGGLGAETFKEYARGYGIQMSIQDSYDLRSRWFARWPEMRRYLQEHIAGMAEYVETFPVTQFVSKRVRGGCYYTSAANTYFQGLAADGAKRALYDVSRACYTDPESPLYGSYPVVFVHDEIILETPEHAVHEAAEQLVGVMCASMQKYVPDIPITASAHAMRVWTKDAEPVYRDERLVPWERAA